MLFLVSSALFVCRRGFAERIIVFALSLWLAYESVLGIMQLLGLAISRNTMCPMTGSFANSGPYGGFLAVCIAVVFAAAWKWRDSGNLYDRILFWLSSVSGCLGIVVLPASMSRTGFVALLVSAVAFVLTNTESKSYFKSHKWLILSVIVVAFIVGGCDSSRNDDAMPFRFFIDIWARGVGHIRDGFISFGCVAVTFAFGCLLRSGDRSKCESRKKGKADFGPGTRLPVSWINVGMAAGKQTQKRG